MQDEPRDLEAANEELHDLRPASEDEIAELESHIRPAEETELPGAEEGSKEPVAVETEDGDFEPISLVDESDEDIEAKPKVRMRSARTGIQHKVEYQRKLNLTGQGATRCRLFYSRIAADSLESLQDRVNDWLDSEEIEIKQVGHVIGTLEGKTPRPNLVVMVWY